MDSKSADGTSTGPKGPEVKSDGKEATGPQAPEVKSDGKEDKPAAAEPSA